MKITSVANGDSKPNGPEYPKLMKSVINGLIVLFHGPSKGMVVANGKTSQSKVGDYSEVWGMQYFEPYYGTVSITSKHDD